MSINSHNNQGHLWRVSFFLDVFHNVSSAVVAIFFGGCDVTIISLLNISVQKMFIYLRVYYYYYYY